MTCSEEKLPVVIYFSKTEDLIKHYPLESQPFDQLLNYVKYEMCFAKQLITTHAPFAVVLYEFLAGD